MSSNDSYDPAEAAERKGSQYLTRKDIRNLGIVLVILLVLLYPVYRWLQRGAEEYVCKRNLQAIAGAIGAYKEEFGDYFPPLFSTAGGTEAPYLDDRGVAVTWGTSLAPYLKEASAFTCPSAREDEQAKSQGSRGAILKMTYGFYAPYAVELAPAILEPGRTIVIVETSNFGANETFDPLKFSVNGAVVPQDGFAIGFDDAQMYPTESSRALTRLAFGGTADGQFGEESRPRHGDSINALTAEGSLVTISPGAALFKQGRYWSVPVKR
ncbi:MAG: hypothetical protein WAO58_03245 [Fimbriimonadaceae bacterium]